MPRHSDALVGFQSLGEQRVGPCTITWCATIPQHHGVKTVYLRLFKKMRYGLRLSQRSLKMGFGGFPPPRCGRGYSKDSLREAEDRPEHDGSSIR